ncbi:MAG: hypothetical protein ACT4OZ_10455 [Gemmatimonadota bacterium]
MINHLGDEVMKVFHVSEDAAMSAVEQESSFNVIDMISGYKVDRFVRKSRPFSSEEFRRRRVRNVLGIELPIATGEDVIISKMESSSQLSSARSSRTCCRFCEPASVSSTLHTSSAGPKNSDSWPNGGQCSHA